MFASSCPVYDDITTEEVIDEAVKNVEEVADKMYDDESIKILNLNVMKESILEGVNPRANFIELIVAISKAVFLTIAGQTVVTKDLDQSFDIS